MGTFLALGLLGFAVISAVYLTGRDFRRLHRSGKTITGPAGDNPLPLAFNYGKVLQTIARWNRRDEDC